MNRFDKMIKSKAKIEKIVVPADFDERIDYVIDNLSNSADISSNRKIEIKKKFYLSRKFMAAALVIIILITYMSIIGFDNVYATVTKMFPYIAGFGVADDSNSNSLYAAQDDITFYDKLNNKYIIKSAYKEKDEVIIIVYGYFKKSRQLDIIYCLKNFKLACDGVEYKAELYRANTKYKGILSKYKEEGQIKMGFHNIPNSKNMLIVYKDNTIPLKLEKVIPVHQDGIYANGNLYKLTLMPIYNKNMVGVEAERKNDFPSFESKKLDNLIAIYDCFFQDDSGKQYSANKLIDCNEFILDKGNLLDMKCFVVNKIADEVKFSEKDCPTVTFKMPRVGETVNINYRDSIYGFNFTIQSAAKKVVKQKYDYWVNREELTITVVFDNLPQDVNIYLMPYFGGKLNYGYEVNDGKRNTDGKVLYEYIFHNDSGILSPGKSNFLDKNELVMKIKSCDIVEDIRCKFLLK